MNELKKILILTALVSFFTSVIVSGFITGVSNVKFLQKLTDLPSMALQNITGNNKTAQNGVTYTPQTTQEQITINTVKQASQAVVSIIATKDLPVIQQYNVNPFQGQIPDDLFNQLFGGGSGFTIPQYRQNGTQQQQVSAGSGFLISADGLILTNKHVVEDATAQYTVILNNKEKLKATVLAKDPAQDLAVVKIEKTGMPYLTLGDSDKIQIGQSVIAIGNALGQFENTVSVGVISGLQRTVTASDQGAASETLDDIIQTDAAINPGNSGGPLLNLKGEVIGIDTAIAQGAQNIGFAIPINKAKRDVSQVKSVGKISYPFLGVRYQIIDSDVAAKNKLSVDYGALIVKGSTSSDVAVTPGSPAAKAGLKEGDVILEIDGAKITSDNTLAQIIAKKSVGDVITMNILSGGSEKTVQATLAERKP